MKPTRGWICILALSLSSLFSTALPAQVSDLAPDDYALLSQLLEEGPDKNKDQIASLSVMLPPEQKNRLYQDYAQSALMPFVLNLLPVPAGSFLQGDMLSGAVITVCKVGGLAVFCAQFIYQGGPFIQGVPLLWVVGGSLMGIGEIIGFISPWVYAKRGNDRLRDALCIPLEPKKH